MLIGCYKRQFSKIHFLVGLLQLITAFAVIGWIWSIAWGLIIFLNPERHSQKPLLDSKVKQTYNLNPAPKNTNKFQNV